MIKNLLLLFCFIVLFANVTIDANGFENIHADAHFPERNAKAVKLGQLLFYDPILSGNKSVACASCHHPKFASGDGVSLSIGDGGKGLGTERHSDPNNPPQKRIARNAPTLFNLGANEFRVIFHDGRLEINKDGTMRTPLGDDMAVGFNDVLAAQAMFPVISANEMAGHYGENTVAKAVRQGRIAHIDGAWQIIASRVQDIITYRLLFADLGINEISFADIANVIADFIAFEWRADNSAFDQFLRDGVPLEPQAEIGRQLFYGKAKCIKCHSGQFQTDHKFHAIAMPQIGPGKAAAFENHYRDVGRMLVTGEQKHAFTFRTPSLRNVVFSAPYGHAGAYAQLKDVVRHHLNPIAALNNYHIEQAIFPQFKAPHDNAIMNDPSEVAKIAAANTLKNIVLTDNEVTALLAFLHALTDVDSLTGRLGIPSSVPSGLSIE